MRDLGDLRECSPDALPEALARLHVETRDAGHATLALSPHLDLATLHALLEGAGFVLRAAPHADALAMRAHVERVHTLPDRVRPGLRILVCGLNPSLYSAETGIPFGRPGNRFWPAARRAGLVDVERDCDAALRAGIGFTDLAKRATRSSAELTADEYRVGVLRVSALVERIAPAAVCFVGLEGYRRAVERSVQPGWLAAGLGQRPAYLMPCTSGLNARIGVEALAAHLACAARAADAVAR